MHDSAQDRHGSEGPILDASVIETLRELGGADEPDLLAELVEIFLSDAPRHIQDMHAAVERSDFELLERAAHTLKSSAANLGARDLSERARELESAARERQRERTPELATRCSVAFRFADRALRQLIA